MADATPNRESRKPYQTANKPAESAQEEMTRAMPVDDSDTDGTASVPTTLEYRDSNHNNMLDTVQTDNRGSSHRLPPGQTAKQTSERKTPRIGQPVLTFRSAVPESKIPTPWEKRVDLTYAQMLRTPQEAISEKGTSQTKTENSFSQELPSWAQAVLQQNGGQLPPFGAQSDSASGAKSGNTGGYINWSAPNALPAGRPFHTEGIPSVTQSPMVFRSKDGAASEQSPRSQESEERAAKRMADKVYRIIEERLRKELRRGGN